MTADTSCIKIYKQDIRSLMIHPLNLWAGAETGGQKDKNMGMEEGGQWDMTLRHGQRKRGK